MQALHFQLRSVPLTVIGALRIIHGGVCKFSLTDVPSMSSMALCGARCARCRTARLNDSKSCSEGHMVGMNVLRRSKAQPPSLIINILFSKRYDVLCPVWQYYWRRSFLGHESLKSVVVHSSTNNNTLSTHGFCPEEIIS